MTIHASSTSKLRGLNATTQRCDHVAQMTLQRYDHVSSIHKHLRRQRAYAG